MAIGHDRDCGQHTAPRRPAPASLALGGRGVRYPDIGLADPRIRQRSHRLGRRGPVHDRARHPGWGGEHLRHDSSGHGSRPHARGAVRHHGAFAKPGAAHGRGGLRVVLPWDAAAVAVADLVQSGAHLSPARHPGRGDLAHRRRDHAVRRNSAGTRHQPGRLHGGGRTRRDPIRRSRPGRGGAEHRHGPGCCCCAGWCCPRRCG